MVMVMYAQCIALCAGLSYEHLRNLRFLGLRRDEHELSVPVDKVLAANRLQLCDDTKGTVRETRAPAGGEEWPSRGPHRPEERREPSAGKGDRSGPGEGQGTEPGQAAARPAARWRGA